MCYKYIVSVEATWTHSGPGGSTQRLHHKHTGWKSLLTVIARVDGEIIEDDEIRLLRSIEMKC